AEPVAGRDVELEQSRPSLGMNAGDVYAERVQRRHEGGDERVEARELGERVAETARERRAFAVAKPHLVLEAGLHVVAHLRHAGEGPPRDLARGELHWLGVGAEWRGQADPPAGEPRPPAQRCPLAPQDPL